MLLVGSCCGCNIAGSCMIVAAIDVVAAVAINVVAATVAVVVLIVGG